MAESQTLVALLKSTLLPWIRTFAAQVMTRVSLSLYTVSMLTQPRILILFTLIMGCASISHAKETIEDTTEYSSKYDESLTFKKMTFLPSVDNVNGVYAKAIDKRLEDLVANKRQWDFAQSHIVGSIVRPEELVGHPEKVRNLAKNLDADGFFIAELRKDPQDVTVHLYLFSRLSGELVSEETQKIASDGTNNVLSTLEKLFAGICQKIPYDALVVSRTDNRITINAGIKDGVQVGQNLTAIKIISAEKHPKRNFLIKTNKVLMGQIRVVKADNSLSFADVISETEPGVLNTGVKITGINFTRHQQTPWTNTYTPPEVLLSENNKSVFGKDPNEWIAKDPPTFGRVGANLSMGSFDNSVGLSNGSNLNSKVGVYPKIDLHGEVWITPKIYANASFAQGIGQSENPTGNPSEVSNSLTQYRLSFGYNFILKDEFFGPKLTFDLGFSSYRMFVDTTSNQGFTTLQYRSLPLGIGGYVPINPSKSWAIGGKAYFHLFPSLKETPFSSGGDPKNNINNFLFYAENKISQRLRWTVGIDFLLLSTTYSGQGGRITPASNSSHRFTMLTTGIDYLF